MAGKVGSGMPSEVTDPNLLQQLNSGPQEVTDPSILQQLNTSFAESSGFFGRVNESLVRRGVNISEELIPTQTESFGETLRRAPGRAFRTTGQAAGFVGDVVSEAIGTGVKSLKPAIVGIAGPGMAPIVETAPKAFKGAVGEAVSRVSEDPRYKPFIEGVSGSVEKFKRENPEAWKNLGSVTNILSVGLASKPARALSQMVKESGRTVLKQAIETMPGRKSLESASEKIYASAAKMPLSKKWTQVIPSKELSARQIATKTGISERVPISEYGLQKATQLESEAKGMVDAVINAGTKSGDVVKTEDMLKGLDAAYKMAANSSDPRRAAEIIDKVAESFMSRPKTLTTAELQKVKRQLYKEVQDYTGEFKSIYDVAQKGIAHEAMITLEQKYPSLHMLNAKDAAYIKLKEAIEKSVAREANKDILGLGAKVLANRNIFAAFWEKTIGHPAVKSRLAFALDKAARLGKRERTIQDVILGTEKQTKKQIAAQTAKQEMEKDIGTAAPIVAKAAVGNNERLIEKYKNASPQEKREMLKKMSEAQKQIVLGSL